MPPKINKPALPATTDISSSPTEIHEVTPNQRTSSLDSQPPSLLATTVDLPGHLPDDASDARSTIVFNSFATVLRISSTGSDPTDSTTIRCTMDISFDFSCIGAESGIWPTIFKSVFIDRLAHDTLSNLQNRVQPTIFVRGKLIPLMATTEQDPHPLIINKVSIICLIPVTVPNHVDTGAPEVSTLVNIASYTATKTIGGSTPSTVIAVDATISIWTSVDKLHHKFTLVLILPGSFTDSQRNLFSPGQLMHIHGHLNTLTHTAHQPSSSQPAATGDTQFDSHSIILTSFNVIQRPAPTALKTASSAQPQGLAHSASAGGSVEKKRCFDHLQLK